MARPISEKCRRCAKVPVEVAKAKDCWEGQRCHVRRSNYKTRALRNQRRRQQYRAIQGAALETTRADGVTVVEVSVPKSIAAIVHLYRTTKSAPLHAISADLLQSGVLVAQVEPVHTLGWTGTQVKQYLRAVLRSFSEQVGEEMGQFEAQVEHDPRRCPIVGCPLRED